MYVLGRAYLSADKIEPDSILPWSENVFLPETAKFQVEQSVTKISPVVRSR